MTEISTVQLGFPLLSILIILPAIGALIALFTGGLAKTVALVISVLQLALAMFAWLSLDSSTAAMQFAESASLFGLGYQLGIDGISAMFLPATALLTLFAVMYASKSVETKPGAYLAALLFSEAALMGAFAATDLSLFWVFFVLEIIPGYLLIKGWGTSDERNAAARNYVLYMVLASLAIGAGFLIMATSGSQPPGFSLQAIATQGIDPAIQTLIFFLLCVGFAIKAPLFPVHSWLPKVLEHGPMIGMSVFLVGIKLGAYGLLRFVVPLLPEATEAWFWLLAAIGFASMVYGALIALVQTNLRRLMAFASISHMGVVTLGLFSLNVAGIEGGLLQALNLGLTGAGLFLIAGFLSTRVGTPDLSNMGGLHARTPLLAFGFLVIALAAVGMPGTSGFNGEHMVMLGAFEKHWLMALCVGIGPILAAAYFLRYYLRAFLGDAPATDENVADLEGNERIIVGSLVAVVLIIGLYTTPFIETMRSSVESITSEYHQSSHTKHKTGSDAAGQDTASMLNH